MYRGWQHGVQKCSVLPFCFVWQCYTPEWKIFRPFRNFFYPVYNNTSAFDITEQNMMTRAVIYILKTWMYLIKQAFYKAYAYND